MKDFPIGTDDFKEIIDNDYWLIDKSLFIKSFLENNSKVSLITRPRRWCKTTNMSMLSYFLDIAFPHEERDRLFNGLKIMTDSDGH